MSRNNEYCAFKPKWNHLSTIYDKEKQQIVTFEKALKEFGLVDPLLVLISFSFINQPGPLSLTPYPQREDLLRFFNYKLDVLLGRMTFFNEFFSLYNNPPSRYPDTILPR